MIGVFPVGILSIYLEMNSKETIIGVALGQPVVYHGALLTVSKMLWAQWLLQEHW